MLEFEVCLCDRLLDVHSSYSNFLLHRKNTYCLAAYHKDYGAQPGLRVCTKDGESPGG